VANKLAGQRAKFSRARAIFYSAGDEAQRDRAAQLMAEVLVEAPVNGFSEEQVTQSADVPDVARQLAAGLVPASRPSQESDDELVSKLQEIVDTSDLVEIGSGPEAVYAYGYRCAPDRLKIGSCSGEVVARVAAQIGTSTPDKPVLLLRIATHDCRALERVLHGVLRLQGKRVSGAGAEWFITSRDDVAVIYERVVAELGSGSAPQVG
jgi:hypothetical protein